MFTMFRTYGAGQSDKSSDRTLSRTRTPETDIKQIYLAKKIESGEWLHSKVEHGVSTACIHFSEENITFHTKGNKPIQLDAMKFAPLFFKISDRWAGLATPLQFDYIKAALEGDATKDELTRRNSF